MKKNILIIVFVIFLLCISGFLLKIVLFPVNALNKGIDSAYNITDKTLDADNIIYNYEWFKQQVEDINATKEKREIAKNQILTFKDDAGLRKDWTFEDKNEYNRLSAVKMGLDNYLRDLIATYNARSKMANRSIFKDGLIPNTFENIADVIK